MDIQLQSRRIAAIRFRAEGQIAATRGFDIVAIQLPLRIELEVEPSSTWLCDQIDLDLFAVIPTHGESLLASGRLHMVLESRKSRYDPETTVELRCTPAAIAAYEGMRDGGPVDLRLKVNARVHELEPGSAHRKMLCVTQTAWGQEDFRVDTAKWTRGLMNAGLAASVLVEIPFPLHSDPHDPALEALTNAFASFQNGAATGWKACIGDIRPYLEHWTKVEPTPPQQPPKGSAADRKFKLLRYRDALYQCCHYWVHEAASETSRNDAVLALGSFAALLKAYRS